LFDKELFVELHPNLSLDFDFFLIQNHAFNLIVIDIVQGFIWDKSSSLVLR